MEGQLVHFELPAEDAGRAKEFWKSLFGWKFREWTGPVEYHMLEGLEPGGAIYPSEDQAKARELGGSADDRQPIPTIGWFARCRDTEGNEFSLFQADETVPAPDNEG